MHCVLSTSLKSAGCSFVLLATTLSASAPNLLVNGDFEAASIPGVLLSPGSTAIPGWTVGGAPNSNVMLATGYWTSNYNHWVDLTGATGSASGAYIEQSFATVAGKTYDVTVDGFNGSNFFSVAGLVYTPGFSISATGNPARAFAIAPGTGAQVSCQFVARGPITTLRLTDLSTVDTNAAWIDNVSVQEALIPDTTPPVITGPVSITVEATGPSGAVVTFAATAVDAISGPEPVSATPASGSTFAIGSTPVSLSATDAAGNVATGRITVNVVDTKAPVPTASLVNISKGGDDESSQFFRVVFAATDAVGVTSLTATLNGVAVTNGQVVQLQLIKSGAQSTKRDDGRLQIKATSFTLTVTAADRAANKRTATATAVFIKNGKDDDDKKDDKDERKNS